MQYEYVVRAPPPAAAVFRSSSVDLINDVANFNLLNCGVACECTVLYDVNKQNILYKYCCFGWLVHVRHRFNLRAHLNVTVTDGFKRRRCSTLSPLTPNNIGCYSTVHVVVDFWMKYSSRSTLYHLSPRSFWRLCCTTVRNIVLSFCTYTDICTIYRRWTIGWLTHWNFNLLYGTVDV